MNRLRSIILVFLLLPAFAYAQADIFDLTSKIAGWISDTIPVLLGIIMVVIFWNLGQFVLHAGDEQERIKYKQFMIWGVVSVFLIVSFWGIVYAITRTFFNSPTNSVLERPGYVDRNGQQIIVSP